MNRADGRKGNLEVADSENGLPLINGSMMVPVDIEMRDDEEYSEVKKSRFIHHPRYYVASVSITCQ